MKDNVYRLGDPDRHFWLTRASARVLGVNLSQALARGVLSMQDYSGMVTACRKCALVEHCQSWLATEAMPRREVYSDCANKPILDRLQ